MKTQEYTLLAQEMFGEFVIKAGKTFFTVKTLNVFDEEVTLKITPANLAVFYATQSRNISSGIRTLAGLSGDWRPISQLADLALEWFKEVNLEAMRRESRKSGLIPKF